MKPSKPEVVIPASPPPAPAGDPPSPPPPPPAPMPPPLPSEVNVPPAPAKNDPPGPSRNDLPPASPAPKPGHEIVIPASGGVIAATPPIAARPRNPSAPTDKLVDSWDEKVHVWTKGDSFAALSQGAYSTEDYAAALQMYNRNHPRASASLRRDGTVAEGDKIYIPEQRILEKRHADVIAKPKPKTEGAGAAPAAVSPVQAGFNPADLPPPPGPAPQH